MCRPGAQCHSSNTFVQAARALVLQDTSNRFIHRRVHLRPSAAAHRGPHQLRIYLLPRHTGDNPVSADGRRAVSLQGDDGERAAVARRCRGWCGIV